MKHSQSGAKHKGDLRSSENTLTRQDILCSADQWFAKIGYRKTTIDDIVSGLGTSRANIYRFFPARASLNEALAELHLGRIGDELESIVNLTEPPPQRLTCFLRTLAHLSAEKIVANGHANDLVKDSLIAAWPVSLQFLARVQSLLSRLLDAGSDTKDFHIEDPGLAVACVKMIMMNYIHPTLASCHGSDNPDIEHVIKFILSLVSSLDREPLGVP